jgi:mono/diheme cytochrome c family protein
LLQWYPHGFEQDQVVEARFALNFDGKIWRLVVQSSRMAVFFALLFPLSVNAEELGDPRAGLAFARAHCAECHAVTDAEDKSRNPDAPTFASVSKTPGINERALAVWLQTSHPTMPNFIIADVDRQNVIAYIMSLQPLPPQ